MNRKKQFLAVVFLLALPLAVLGQGTFQNLNFESANVAGYSTGGVPITNALPRWRGYLGTNQVNTIVYNTVSLGAAEISLQSSTSGIPPIAGNYSVVLQSSIGVEPTTAAVGQTGQIPATAMSLRFYGDTGMQVTFIGQLLSLFELGIGPDYQIVGADISGFAGQTGELKFLMPRLGPPGSSSSSYLDNIVFSNQPIPEPGTLVILSLGALFVSHRSRRTRS